MEDKHQNQTKRPTLNEIYNQERGGSKLPIQKYWRKWKSASNKATPATDNRPE